MTAKCKTMSMEQNIPYFKYHPDPTSLILILTPEEYDENTQIFKPITQKQIERAKLFMAKETLKILNYEIPSDSPQEFGNVCP